MNNQDDLNESAFAAMVAIYGGELQRFPAEYRMAAQHLLARSEVARQRQQTALTLDNLLDTVEIAPAPPSLRQRILRAARLAPPPDIWQRLWQWMVGNTPNEYLWRPAAIFLLPLLLGTAIGFYSVRNANEENIYVQAPQNMPVATDVQTTSIDRDVDLLGLSGDEFSGWKE
jgi:hypothetical protein